MLDKLADPFKTRFREHFRKMKSLKILTRFFIAISKIMVIHFVKF